MSRSRQAEVLIRNEAFYSAFTTRDLAAMEDLWSEELHVSCLHPGTPPLFGRDAVMTSWAQILSGRGRPPIQCLEPKVRFLGDELAMVICFEQSGGETLAATNIFALEAGEWVLVHHQSGLVASDEAEMAEIPTSRFLQ